MQPSRSKPIDKAWAEAFQDALAYRSEPQGQGWETFPQIKKRFNMGFNRTHDLIRQLVKEGKLEKFVGHKSNGRKLVREVWYRPSTLSGIKTP